MTEPLIVEGVLNYVCVYGGVSTLDIDDESLIGLIEEHFSETKHQQNEHQYYEEFGKVRVTIELLDDTARRGETT